MISWWSTGPIDSGRSEHVSGTRRAIRRAGTGSALGAFLIAAACSAGGPEPAADDAAANAVSEPATAKQATAAAGSLSRYVGRHPSEPVEGMRFIDEPRVRAAVAASVPDRAVRDFVFNYNGPDAPIVAKDGRILAWGCEAHNCGYHNWSVAITPDGGSADVCFYHDDNSPEGPATWYLSGGRMEQRPGNCPSD